MSFRAVVFFAIGLLPVASGASEPPLSQPAVAIAQSGAPAVSVLPEFYAPDPVLAGYIRAALEANPGVQEGLATYRASLERVSIANALPDPMVSFTQALRAVETRVGPQLETVVLSQAFPWFGKLDLRGKVAVQEAAAMFQMYRTRQREVIAQVKTAFYNLAYVDSALGIAREEQGLLGHYEELAQARYASGQGLQHAVIKMQAEITKSVTSPDGTLEYVNPAFTALFGYDRADLPDRATWFEKAFSDPSERDTMERNYQEDATASLETLSSRPRTMMIRTRDGRRLVCEARVQVLPTGEHLVVYENITDRSRLEMERVNTGKMEAMGNLAGGIAHSVNNILMGIQGYTSLMLMKKNPGDPDFRHLKAIEAQVRAGSDLTGRILTFSRSGMGKFFPADLNEIVRKTAAVFGNTRSDIPIRRKLQDGRSKVEADQGQIEKALIILYVKARQSMPKGGELGLSAHGERPRLAYRSHWRLPEPPPRPRSTGDPGHHEKRGLRLAMQLADGWTTRSGTPAAGSRRRSLEVTPHAVQEQARDAVEQEQRGRHDDRCIIGPAHDRSTSKQRRR